MQHANPPKRPVGRPRLNTTQAQAPLPPRPPPASALNVELINITHSNETTNHFLGAGAVQRPWMRQPDPLAFSAAPHTRLSLNRPSLTTGPASTPSSFAFGPTDGASHVQSPLSNHTQLPPYRFISTPAPAPVEASMTLQNVQKEIQSTVLENEANSGGHNSTAQETSRSPDHIEVLDLTSTNEEDLEAVGNTAPPMPAVTSQSEPILSQQPTAFADLPILEMLDDFNPAATNETNALIDLDTWESAFAAQDATISNAADQPSEIPPPQSSVSRPAPTALVPTQENYTSLSSSTESLRQPTRLPPRNRLERISPALFYGPAILRQPSAMSTAPASQHFSIPSIPHPTPSQLLTPEHSPLSPSTTLSQNQRLVSESSQFRRPLPHPQTGIPQLNPNFSQIPQPMVPSQSHQTTTQPGPTTRSLPSTARRGSTMVPAGNKGISYLATLNTNLEDMSGRLDLSNQQWRLRLPWLQDACQRNDLFFLHLNQLFCMWNMNPATVRYLGINQNCEPGFAVLELLFGKNTNLPKELLAFLAGWPNSTYSLEFNDQMKQWTSQIAQFLPVFGSNWSLLRKRCLERRVPPMISEIIHHLGCPMSVILPRAIFCSLQKQISPAAPTVLLNAVVNFFDSNTTAACTGQRGSSEFHNFKAVYQNIYAQFLRTPGLNQDQINEIRSILIQHDPPRPFNQTAHASQTQTRKSSVQTSPNINVSNEAFATGANTAHGRPTNAASYRSVSNTPLQASPNSTPTIPRPVVNSTTTSVQQAFDANATTMQQLLSNIGSAMRPPNVPATHTRQNLLSPNVTITQRGATSLPTPPLLSSGFIPNASERLLPIDALHLPDFLVNPDPIQESLHQVCLRQPMTVLKDSLSGDQRLYQYIESFVLNPYPWLPSLGFISISFDVSEELFKRRSETIELVMGPFEIPKRTIGSDSVLFNLRCAKIDDHHSEDEIGYSWAALPTFWPQHIFISINNKHLDIRRKRHNRRDLPIDVTSFVQPGKNEVKISIHPEASERNVKCGVAVEAIGFCDYERALTLPTKIDAETSLKSITSVMEPQQDPNDDDLVLMDDSMTISITDPFSAQVFTIPVRGRHCKHRECFDLETFLKSRQSDYKDALSSVYAWQCPICKGDTRPNHLVIDEFFREVRDKVFELGEEEARAIIVKADGTWEVKQDPVENTTADRRTSRQRSQGSEAPPTTSAAKVMGQDSIEPTGNMGSATASSLYPASSRIVEVIELD